MIKKGKRGDIVVLPFPFLKTIIKLSVDETKLPRIEVVANSGITVCELNREQITDLLDTLKYARTYMD